MAAKLDGQSFVAIRQAGDTGQLYGSVTTRDLVEIVTAGGFSIDRRQVVLDRPIKTLGIHATRIALHPEVIVGISLNDARTEDEAERQARGEDVTVVKEEALQLETYNPDAVFEDETLADTPRARPARRSPRRVDGPGIPSPRAVGVPGKVGGARGEEVPAPPPLTAPSR